MSGYPCYRVAYRHSLVRHKKTNSYIYIYQFAMKIIHHEQQGNEIVPRNQRSYDSVHFQNIKYATSARSHEEINSHYCYKQLVTWESSTGHYVKCICQQIFHTRLRQQAFQSFTRYSNRLKMVIHLPLLRRNQRFPLKCRRSSGNQYLRREF